MQAELHRHLDVSIRTETLLSLAQERGLEAQTTSLKSFQEKLYIKNQLSDLTSFLAKFTLFQKVMDRPDVLERIAFEAVEDCWNEGTRLVELRYAPNFVSELQNLGWEESLAAFERGIQKGMLKFPGMKAGLICIAVRDFGADQVDRTVEFYLKNSHRFIGLDLAGNEDQYPCRLFESSFKKAIQKGAKITIHAGEASGPENIWEAIELLGAKRIGHGISSVQDPQLIQYLAKNQICLEMCPFSNWITSAVSSLKEHPLPQVLQAGVPVCINTDDPGVLGVTLKDEIQICLGQLRMSKEDITRCQEYALKASFLSN